MALSSAASGKDDVIQLMREGWRGGRGDGKYIGKRSEDGHFFYIVSASSATNNCLAAFTSQPLISFGSPSKKKIKAEGGNVEQWIMMHGE